MKKSILLTFILVLALSVVAYASSEDSSKKSVEQTEKSFIGNWYGGNRVEEDAHMRYAFYDDGTFIYGNGEVTGANRELYKIGTWSVANEQLRLEVSARWVAPVGDIKKLVPSDDTLILDEGLLKLMYNPPQVETYIGEFAGKISAVGRNAIVINGILFYTSDEEGPDFFDDFHNLSSEKK